jgi:PAS domain S-box-containing protein
VITDSAAGKNDLQAKLETLEGIVQASPLAIVAVDRSGIVQMWNAQAVTVFGWTAEEVLGKALPNIPEGKEPEFRSLLEFQLQGSQSTGLELRRRRKDGTLVDVDFWSAPAWNAAGEIGRAHV